MRRLEAALCDVVRDLKDLGRPFALLGGFAVSARVEPRTTKDIDLAVLVDSDADAESLASALSRRGYAIHTTIEHKRTGRLATARTTAPSGAIVDLLFASSGIEPEVVAAATEIEILDGLTVPVAIVGHLIAMKILARDDRLRPQDRVDLAGLFQNAGDEDIATARSALHLIDERGYGRGRPLLDELRAALDELGP
ncbi:MAG: nucleotidyl transferase AbiEii/AbiGii toxin family protein [Polyangiaceae bacterium]